MWILAGAVTAAAAGCLLRSRYERQHLETVSYDVVSPKIKKERTLVFLSDLHDNCFGPENETLLKAIDQIHPDVVLIGGDMMVCKGKKDTRIPRSLIRCLREKGYPVVYGNGNHEIRMRQETHIYGTQYEEYKKQLKQIGVCYLENEGVDLGDDLKIWGVDLERIYYKKFSKERLTSRQLKKKLGAGDPGRFQILLIHSPMFFDACRRWGADLSLSGHFHGGTIRLPLLGGVMTPQFQFFLPWCRGIFREAGKTMIVSPGLGTHSINIRLNNKPQLIVVNLKKETIFC